MSTVLFSEPRSFPITAQVMVIDDQLTSRLIMENIIKSIGDNIHVTTYETALPALEDAKRSPPDLIVVDYKLPDINGVDFTRKIRNIAECMDVPIVIFTVVDDKAVMYESLDAGATDFLTKPIDHYECKVRCRNLLTMRRQQMIIRERAVTLEKLILSTNESVHVREKEVLSLLNRAVDIKGGYSGYHPLRVGIISMLIARHIGMDKKFCEHIEIAAPLHDIGEVRVPGALFLKNEKLDKEEWEMVREHTIMGHDLLNRSSSPILILAASIALCHHEHYDGSGYPNRLKGKDIPIEARIVAVADTYDAMTTQRSYRAAYKHDEVLEILTAQKGLVFDPACVDALLLNLDHIFSANHNLAN